MKNFVTKFLDLSAAIGLYDYWARRHLEDVHNRLIELADLREDEKILDLGCGTGQLIAMINARHPDCRIHGIDPGHHMIKIALKKNHSGISSENFVTGRATCLPYEDNTFDCVFSCLVFHLLDEQKIKRALVEIRRVLKPHGRYISIEFESYPGNWMTGKQAHYPKALLAESNLAIDSEFPGPSITRRHHTIYRRISSGVGFQRTDTPRERR